MKLTASGKLMKLRYDVMVISEHMKLAPHGGQELVQYSLSCYLLASNTNLHCTKLVQMSVNYHFTIDQAEQKANNIQNIATSNSTKPPTVRRAPPFTTSRVKALHSICKWVFYA